MFSMKLRFLRHCPSDKPIGTTTKSENVASRFWNQCSSIASHLTSKTSTINQWNWDKWFEDRKITNKIVVHTTTTGHFTSLIGRKQLRDWQTWKTHVQSVHDFCSRASFIVKYANLGRCRHRRRDGCLSSLITSSYCPLSPTPPSTGGLTKRGEPVSLSETSFQPAFQEASNLSFIAYGFPTLNNRWIQCSTVLMKVKHLKGLQHLSELANPIG